MMPNQRHPDKVSMLLRLPKSLKERLYRVAAESAEVYGVANNAQELARRAIQDKCDTMEREMAQIRALRRSDS